MSGSKESPGYAIMEAEALAKKPEERETWEVRYLDSLEEMRQAEINDRHPVAWAVFQLVMFYMLLAPVIYFVVRLLTI